MPPSIEPEPMITPQSARRLLALAGLLVALLVAATKSQAVQETWHALTGNKMPVAANVPQLAGKPALSEHQREWIEKLEPQPQMEALIEAAINHEEGATTMIAEKLPSWQGNLENSKRWNDLMMTALYSNDLRVRAAAIEINLMANHLEKTNDAVESLIQKGEDDLSSRPWSAWMLGMLANRGVQTERVTAKLEDWMHDPNEQSRIWAIEGLANTGSESTIKDFLWVFKNDDSMNAKERAGCSLAKSGMMTRVQRMQAVPGLIELAGDTTLNDQTRSWIYQALREITDERIGNDPQAWQSWWLEHGQERIQKFAGADGHDVLGNS